MKEGAKDYGLTEQDACVPVVLECIDGVVSLAKGHLARETIAEHVKSDESHKQNLSGHKPQMPEVILVEVRGAQFKD